VEFGEFFIDEIKVLNAIKKEWAFKPGPQHAFGMITTF